MNKGLNVAYIRISSIEQNAERQFEAMQNCGIDRYFEEKASAKDCDRAVLKEMLEFVRENDVIYVKDFSRLARSTKDLLDIVELLNQKGVSLISLKENLDSKTSTGKLMLTLIGAIYEFERANLLERQREGIEIAKRKGKYKGRKPVKKPANWVEIYSQWKVRALSAKNAMKELDLKANTFYKFVREYEYENEKVLVNV